MNGTYDLKQNSVKETDITIPNLDEFKKVLTAEIKNKTENLLVVESSSETYNLEISTDTKFEFIDYESLSIGDKVEITYSSIKDNEIKDVTLISFKNN